jgi:hypothetical protein
MRLQFSIFTSLLIFQAAVAQNPASSVSEQGVVAAPATVSTTTANTHEATSSSESNASNQIAIIDYKSVYEAETLEDEVKFATDRFSLTPTQQDIWLTAAKERREIEKNARIKFDAKDPNTDKAAVYMGLRAAHNTFYEIIIGYLSPAQKQSLEEERLIQQERQKRLAKLTPPPTLVIDSVKVAPIDSSMIKPVDPPKKKKSQKKG